MAFKILDMPEILETLFATIVNDGIHCYFIIHATPHDPDDNKLLKVEFEICLN